MTSKNPRPWSYSHGRIRDANGAVIEDITKDRVVDCVSGMEGFLPDRVEAFLVELVGDRCRCSDVEEPCVTCRASACFIPRRY